MKKWSLIETAKQIASSVRCDETLADLHIDSDPFFSKKVEEANNDLRGVKLPKEVTRKLVRSAN